MNITVIGSGYVGLVAGACFSDTGHKVICADIDETKISNLNKGVIPIYEPGLDHIVERNIRYRNLSFTTDVKKAVEFGEVIFIAVGTPQEEDGSADLKYVLSVAKSIGQFMNGYKVVVDKSTVPVGTAEKVKKEISKHTSHPFDVVSNPETLKEGTALDDFLKPDRIIIGADSEKAHQLMEKLYEPFVRNNHPIYKMDLKSAEIAKYAANSMLATRISFMNEVANLCDKVGADVNHVRKAIGSDKRIGSAFLYSGIGYGGSCFPKDVQAFVKTASEYGLEFPLLRAVELVNKKQKTILFDKIMDHYQGNIKGKVFSILGLAFKPETDDIREAPAIDIISALLKQGASVRLTDPEAINNMKRLFPAETNKISYFEEPYETAKDGDALVILTEWREYRNLDFTRLNTLLKAKVLFDGRNVYSIALRKDGYVYYCIGAN